MKTLREISRTSLAWLLVFGLAIALRLSVKAQGTTDNLSVWQDADVGFSSVGNFQVDPSGTFTLTDNGIDLWGTNDSFHFVYQTLNGNGQITARILGNSRTSEWAKAGVMIRETLDDNARNAANLVESIHGERFQWRSVAGGVTDMGVQNTNTLAPLWVRLVRNGDWIGAYSSNDGVNWTLFDWECISGLAQTVYVGLAWCNHDAAGAPGTAGFDEVSVAPADLSKIVIPLLTGGDGLKAEYYNNRHLWGVPVTNWVDTTIDLTLGTLVHKGGCRTNEFGIRWTGELVAQFSEPYTFNVLNDDGVRVWLNEQLIIDSWNAHESQKSVSAPINLVAGQHYLLRVEYFQNHGWAQINLGWKSPSTREQIIPESQLYSQLTDSDGNGLPDLWEQHYFGHIGVDPNADPDGDGLSNLQEYQRHSDPTNPLNRGVPNEWTQGQIEDFGGSEGSASYTNGVFTLQSGCTNTLSTHLSYLYQALGTNGEMVARLDTINGNNLATAGIMVRETLDSQSRMAVLQMTPSNGLTFQIRDMVGNKMLQTPQQSLRQQAPYWLKVVRSGDWLGSYVSADGISWTLLDWEFIQGLAPQAFIGLTVSDEVTKGYSNTVTTAQFDQVNFGPANPSDILNPVDGTGDGLVASYRNDSLLYLPGLTNRVESMENYYFVHGPPFTFLNPDGYGVCWSGEVQAQFSERYRFSVQTRREDWVRVWLNDVLIIDGWRKWHADYKVYSDSINLVAGQHYLLRVEMYDNLGQGVSILRWTSPSTPEHPVSQSQLYSQPTDSDGHGLPDIWQQIYFGHTGVDPNADPDGDGLSNLQEYKYHTNPLKADTDSDGLPDAWEIAHGLDPQFNDSGLDSENSGYSNLQDYLYGLDPSNPDSNNDGLPDAFEEAYLGAGTNLVCTNQITVAASVNGSQATNYLGNWQVDGNDIYCLDRRGGLDFNVTLASADKYVLNLFGTQNQTNQFETTFKLLLAIDGQSLGHYTLNAGYGTNGEVALVLPFLPAGPHTVRVFWDGHASFSSLRIHRLQFLSVSGPPNQSGVKKWAMQMIRDESGFDNTNSIISSYTSPVCLEGNDPYPLFMQLTNNLTNNLSTTATSDGRWYLNVPLKAASQTVVQASFQNGVLVQSRNLRWQQVNLLTATNLVIRAGDALLFNAIPTNGVNGTLQVIIGNNTYNGQTTQPVPYRFASNGVYTVKGIYTANGTSLSGSITVDVVQQNLPNVQPAAWTGMQRPLLVSGIAPEATLQADSRLSCVINASSNGVTHLILATGNNDPLSMVTRIGAHGPVLDSTTVSGFDIWSGNQTYAHILQTYPDDSQLIEVMMVSSPVETNVVFVLQPIVSGVIFEDGTTTKTLTSTNFDALGQCPIRFIRPASVTTSVCHQIQAFQGKYQIGYRH